MITLRRSDERGRTGNGWLESRHTFSFADYHDPAQTGFGALRVLNEDRVAPSAGFPPHGHRDMEILTWVVDGALEHRDNLGAGSVIRPGDVQRLSAGAGMRHSELNASQKEPVHFLQIWIAPRERGLHPSYQQKHFPVEERLGRWCLLVSPDGARGSLTLHQEARIYGALLGARGQTLVHAFGRGRRGWLQVARGEISVGGIALHQGDGAAIAGEEEARIVAATEAEILLIDLL